MTEITGYTMEEINRLGWYKVIPGDLKKSAERLARVRRGDDMLMEEWIITRKDGEKRNLLISTSVLTTDIGQPFVLALMRDVTEKKRMEEEMARRERLDSIGILAGGVAHDFNNLLMSIQGNVSLMLLETDPGDRHNERLKNIEQSISDASELTRQLLGFARGGKYNVATTDLNNVIEKTAYLFGRTRKDIRIQTILEANWPADLDKGQIEQVLMNLFVNAWHAMPGGGDLKISSENAVLDPELSRFLNLKPGRHVKITVSDTGVGMDEETQKKVFDPFFTTRGMSKGTGLGLSSAYGIIKNHGGTITVRSVKGKGATFTIYLPASEKEAIVSKKILPEGLTHGTETVLLVEDEAPVLDVCKRSLSALGYTVLTATLGSQAVETFKERSREIDIVLLDVIMPDLSGGEVFELLKEIDPGVKVLLSSGYSMTDQVARVMERGCKGFIQKPYTIENLSLKVRQILDEDRPPK
jgi:PAS domain S-box-containing protein